MYIIGVDVGASHIKSAIVNKEKLEIIQDDIILYNHDKLNNEKFVDLLIKQIRELMYKSKNKIKYIGVAMPGEIDNKTGTFLGNDFMHLSKIELVDILKSEFSIDVYLTNDCTATLLSELYYGAFVNIDNGLMITAGTGIGTTAFKRKNRRNITK